MTTHLIHTTDTIAGIASRYYGDPTQWPVIVAANNLRSPYISADPLIVYGTPLAGYGLTSAAAAGDSVLNVSGDSLLLRSGALLLLSRFTTGGAHLWDAITIAAYSSGALLLTSALQSNYPAGTLAQICAPRGDARGVVAMPGDLLIIPGVELASSTTADDRYGRDLANDDMGRLLFTDSGDILLVGGVDNLRQQLRNRLCTELGALLRHPEYGSAALAYIGKASGPTLAALLQAAVALAIGSDPRIGSVEQVTVTQSADQLLVNARVVAASDVVNLQIALGA